MGSGTIVVTGAAGFIGGRAALRFAAAGRRVVAIDLPGRSFDHLAGAGGLVDARPADVTDGGSLRAALAGVGEAPVVHCAALMGGWGDPEAYRRVNVEGTRQMAAWAAGAASPRFVYVSSVTVYGMPPASGIDEERPFHSIGLPYADSKIEAERIVMERHRDGLPVTILRPGDVYGPRSTEWVTKLVEAMRSGRMILIGGGRGLVNVTYVDNLVDAMEAALARPVAAGRDYIVTDGRPVTWKAYLEALAAAAGCRPPRLSLPTPLAWPAVLLLEGAGRVARRRPPLSRLGLRLLTARCSYSIERASRELAWTPRVDLTEGMARVGSWLASPTARPC